MALVTTVAGATSDSYCTIAEADAHLAYKSGTTWSALIDATKEYYLKQAAKYIDAETYDGYRYDCSTQTAGRRSGQALEFPRDSDTDYLGDPFVAPAVKECQAELAYNIAAGTATVNAASAGDITRLKVDGVEVEYSEGGGSSEAAQSVRDIIRYYLRDRLATGVRMT